LPEKFTFSNVYSNKSGSGAPLGTIFKSNYWSKWPQNHTILAFSPSSDEMVMVTVTALHTLTQEDQKIVIKTNKNNIYSVLSGRHQ
jgi:hypothetical protein